jgi:hypothetical protein
MKPLLSVRDLRVFLDTASGPLSIVDGVSFDIAAGQVFGLMIGDVLIFEMNPAAGHPQNADKCFEQSALARAVGSDDGHDLPWSHRD